MIYIASYNPNNKYLLKRGQIYHFSIRFGDKIFRRSLKTDCYITAKNIAKKVIETIKGARMESEVLKAIIDDKVEEMIKTTTALIYPRSQEGKSAIYWHKARYKAEEEYNYYARMDTTPMSYKEIKVPTLADTLLQKINRPVEFRKTIYDEDGRLEGYEPLFDGDWGDEKHYAQPNAEAELLRKYGKEITDKVNNNQLSEIMNVLNL